MRIFQGLFIAVNILIFIYLIAPIVVLVGAAFNAEAYMAFPPKSFSLHWFQVVMNDPAFMNALWVSIQLGIAASLLALMIGTMTAYGVERLPSRWRNGMNAFLNSPLQIPTIVLGIALFQLFKGMGIALSFTTLLLGHIILCMPYVVRTVGASLYRFDRSVEEAALTLGASPPVVFWKITLPLLRPALLASAIFGFVVSFGNLAISMFLTSSRITTLPIQMFGYVQFSPDPRIAAISVVVIFVTVCIMYLTEKLVGLDRMF
ncbi:ABC transporter permease [Ammoniphilus sp. YIM 78166]|uniref:ABC transporter permease n=1 Tax=Ammoniphilus sp. YIM 78166 TaxID=1644106 RepID=UPI001431FCFC|nr:ABC transporter permease [Ammoniphilus sp. YIM 78166]